MTLDEKEALLLDSTAVPTAEDWGLDDEGDAALVGELNDALLLTLAEAKSGRLEAGEVLMAAVRGRIEALLLANPDAEVGHSEASVTIARFFALNLDISLYALLRYGEGSVH
jgi:hypothetical protein